MNGQRAVARFTCSCLCARQELRSEAHFTHACSAAAQILTAKSECFAQTDRQIDRQTFTQTDRWMDRQTARQTGRQAGREGRQVVADVVGFCSAARYAACETNAGNRQPSLPACLPVCLSVWLAGQPAASHEVPCPLCECCLCVTGRNLRRGRLMAAAYCCKSARTASRSAKKHLAHLPASCQPIFQLDRQAFLDRLGTDTQFEELGKVPGS